MNRHIWLVITGVAILLVAVGVYEFVLVDNGDEVTPDEGWRTETADDSGWVGIDPAIAVDAQGNPHISYYDQGDRDLKYAYFDGSSWQVETVDSEGDVGEASGVVVDKKGNPHISYIDETTGALKYAAKTADSWEIRVVKTPAKGLQVMTTSIDLDANGYPYIAFNIQVEIGDSDGGGTATTRYARWNGSSWSIEAVSTRGTDVNLVLGADGVPHLVFKKEKADNGGQERIYYATKISGKWQVEIVDKETKAGGDTGIGVDSQNHPHIVYHDYDNGSIKYAKWNGKSWDIQTVVSDIGSEEGLKIFVDADDKPHVIYSDSKREKLMYAVLEGGSWVRETVSRMGNPSIVVDHLGRIHVAHNKSVEGDPKEYCPDYTGSDTEIEILKYSIRE